MTATAPGSTTQASRLAQRLHRHRADVARLRERIPEPEEALSAFVRARFAPQALVPLDPDGRATDGAAWEADDELDAW